MFEEFNKIDTSNEKVERIINAAYEEFTCYGKDKASLNKILKTAGISKGVFYHYFEDKEMLFSYLLYFSIRTTVEAIDNKLDWENKDLILRISEVTKRTLDIMRVCPFMVDMNEKFRNEILAEIKRLNYSSQREKFYRHNIDYGLFKNPDDIEEALHIIRWTYKGVGLELVKRKGNRLDDETLKIMKDKCDRYYKVLTEAFYKYEAAR